MSAAEKVFPFFFFLILMQTVCEWNLEIKTGLFWIENSSCYFPGMGKKGGKQWMIKLSSPVKGLTRSLWCCTLMTYASVALYLCI